MVDSAIGMRIFSLFQHETTRGIAEKLGKGSSTVQGWKTGKSLPTIADLVKISELTKRSLDWLITGKEAGGAEPALTPAQAEAVEACRLLSAKLLDIQRIALIDPVAAQAAEGVLSRLIKALQKSA